MFDSLRDNAYGIYLVHYAFVAWVQYALLPASMPGLAKGFIAFLSALALSWGFVATIRRIPAVARVI
jgi:surface polysaccharide O-acyltransferase-like enzyme